MEINLDKDKIIDLLKEALDYDALKKEVNELMDAKVWHWPEEALDVIEVVVRAAEKIVSDVGSGRIKRDAVVGFLDGLITFKFGRLNPMEAIDGPIIGMGVDFAVRLLNKLGWGDDKSDEPTV